jgi:hypothetical protein
MESYESVKDLNALDEFEQITQTQTPSSSEDQNIGNHIGRKWTKSQVQEVYYEPYTARYIRCDQSRASKHNETNTK